DFDAIPDLERPPPHDERPPREVRQRILERYRDAGRDEAQERGEGAEGFEPFVANHQDADRERHVGEGLAPAIPRPGIGDPPVDYREYESLDDPKPRDHDDRDEQVSLDLRTQAEAISQPVAHGGQ